MAASTRHEEAVDLIRRAGAVVNDAGVPDHLQSAAFTAAIAFICDENRSRERLRSVGQGGKDEPSAEDLDRIADVLGVALDTVRRLYADRGGVPELVVKSGKLPGSKSAAAAEIALLVMAARQSAGLEEFTSSETIRAACKRYGKFDQANFGKHMRSLDNFVLVRGRGSSQERQLTHPGYEEAGRLAQQYGAN